MSTNELQTEYEDDGDTDNEDGTRPPVRRAVSSDKFRYKLLRGPWNTPGEFVRLLNNFGKTGWEVVQVHYDRGRPQEVMLKLWVDDDAA